MSWKKWVGAALAILVGLVGWFVFGTPEQNERLQCLAACDANFEQGSPGHAECVLTCNQDSVVN
ncbi:MAG: hypothetical protein AAF542_00085 [Pseudomonadota bacterium]